MLAGPGRRSDPPAANVPAATEALSDFLNFDEVMTHETANPLAPVNQSKSNMSSTGCSEEDEYDSLLGAGHDCIERGERIRQQGGEYDWVSGRLQ